MFCQSCYFSIFMSLLFSPHKRNKLKDVKLQMTQEKNILTWHHGQSHMGFLVVEPAGDLHTAAVRPRVSLLELPDGQGQVALSQVPQQLVPLGQSAGHRRPVSLDHQVAAASVAQDTSTPARPQPAVIFSVVGAPQRDVRSHRGPERLCRSTTWAVGGELKAGSENLSLD